MIDKVAEETIAQKILNDMERVQSNMEHMRESVEKALENIDKRLEKLENKLEERIRVNGVQNQSITELHARLDGIEKNIASMQERFGDMEERITTITKGLVDTVKNTSVKAWTILAGIAGAIGAMIYIVERILK